VLDFGIAKLLADAPPGAPEAQPVAAPRNEPRSVVPILAGVAVVAGVLGAGAWALVHHATPSASPSPSPSVGAAPACFRYRNAKYERTFTSMCLRDDAACAKTAANYAAQGNVVTACERRATVFCPAGGDRASSSACRVDRAECERISPGCRPYGAIAGDH
jgi:hypothetical protein